MTELFPKITIDINQYKTLHKKGNSHGSSMIDYSKFQIKEPLVAQQYNAAISNNLSQVQGSLNTENSKQQYSENKSSRRLLNNKLNNSIEIQSIQKQPKMSKERQSKTPKQGDQSILYIQNTIDKDNLIRIQKYFTQLKEQEAVSDTLTKKKSYICQKLLDLIEKECVQFQDVFSQMNKVIKRYLICSDNTIIDKLRNLESYFNHSNKFEDMNGWLAEQAIHIKIHQREFDQLNYINTFHNFQYIQLVCFDKDFFTYPQLLNRVIELSLQLNGKIEELQQEKYEIKADGKSQQDKKEKEIMHLEQKYEKLKESFYIQLNSQINQYKQKMEDLEKQNEILKAEKDKHTEQLTRIHENYDKVFYEKYSNYDQTMYEYKAIEKKFEMQNKDYNELKTQYNTIYEAYRKNMNDLKMFKEKNALNDNKIQLLQAEINSLNADNQIYKQTYTPRPNLIEILEINKIDYDKENKNTTSSLVLILKNALNGKQQTFGNIGSNTKIPFEQLPSNVIPISPMKQSQIPNEKKRGNMISLASTMVNENQEQNLIQFSSQKPQSKRLSPTSQKTKANISFIKQQRDVQKTESSNISTTDIKKQKKKITLDFVENQAVEQIKFQVIDRKRVQGNAQDLMQKESKSLQIGDHIKRRVKSTYNRENYQNRSTIDIGNNTKIEPYMVQKQNDNNIDNTLAEFTKRRQNNDTSYDSKYNVRISQSQVYIDDETLMQYQVNMTPREDQLEQGIQLNSELINMKPKEKFLYYIKNRRKVQ